MGWRDALSIQCVVGGTAVPCVREGSEGRGQRVKPCVGNLDVDRSEVLWRREWRPVAEGGYALVEGGKADGGMACSGKSDHLWRKADTGTFSGLPDTLREGGNVDLGKKTCVPETKQKEPFSSVLHAIFLIENDNPRKGILKRICCVWSQVKIISRQPRAFRFLCF